MAEENQPNCADAPNTTPRPPLDYRSPGVSPYDKPVDRYVRWAGFFNRMRGRGRNPLLYYGLLVPLLLVAVWYLRHLVLQLESIARK